jgi:hypothetical protein
MAQTPQIPDWVLRQFPAAQRSVFACSQFSPFSCFINISAVGKSRSRYIRNEFWLVTLVINFHKYFAATALAVKLMVEDILEINRLDNIF